MESQTAQVSVVAIVTLVTVTLSVLANIDRKDSPLAESALQTLPKCTYILWCERTSPRGMNHLSQNVAVILTEEPKSRCSAVSHSGGREKSNTKKVRTRID